MYSYVPKNESRRFRIFCSDKLNQLKQDLKNKGYEVDFYLVGSGMKNLVTRNENESFDLDYNIEFLNVSISQLNPQELKNYIMSFLNKITVENESVFRNCQDSTSAITSRLVFGGKLQFSFDVAILAKNKDGDFCRLIHNKKADENSYHWDKIPKSKKVYKRFEKLKSAGHFNKLRDTYLDKKNFYLIHNDHYHSSFTIFKETVNQTWSKYYRS